MEITQDIIDDFRSDQRAFEDFVIWPNSVVEKALCEADCETGSSRWGGFVIDECHNFKRRGMYFFAAHWLSSTYIQQTAETRSAIKPSARLNISEKTVGDETVGYRITAMQDTGDDWLSTTIYGTQYLRLRKRAGMAGAVV